LVLFHLLRAIRSLSLVKIRRFLRHSSEIAETVEGILIGKKERQQRDFTAFPESLLEYPKLAIHSREGYGPEAKKKEEIDIPESDKILREVIQTLKMHERGVTHKEGAIPYECGLIEPLITKLTAR
jgi:hypothetical protein